jgi:uncharacterized protein Usg
MWIGKTSLVTAHIVYRMPDHLSVLQDFIWQDYDLFPDFPALVKFLRFWQAEIEGPLYSVSVGHVSNRATIMIDLRNFDFSGQRNLQ